MNTSTDADTALSNYLNGHLLASEGGLRAFNAAVRTWQDSAHEQSFSDLKHEIARDRRDLARIIRRLGFKPAAWKRVLTGIAQTAGELNPVNLLRQRGGSMSQLELDVLTGMVRTKLSMWDTLLKLAEHDSRLDTDLLRDLRRRAEEQIDELQRIAFETFDERFMTDSL